MPDARHLRDDFTGIDDADDLANLVDDLTPRITDEQATRLMALIRSAQDEPPSNKKRFVEAVNQLLDVYRIRLGSDDGEIFRLKYLPGSSGYGHIYLLPPRGSNRSGFDSIDLELVDVSDHYLGNRFNADSNRRVRRITPVKPAQITHEANRDQ